MSELSSTGTGPLVENRWQAAHCYRWGVSVHFGSERKGKVSAAEGARSLGKNLGLFLSSCLRAPQWQGCTIHMLNIVGP